jgi:lupus La protein
VTVSCCAGLTAFFSKHGEVRSIRMRKHLTSQDFKGSIFLEMGTVEEAQALMDQTLVHEGATLVRAREATLASPLLV